jgi:hypothetical protein
VPERLVRAGREKTECLVEEATDDEDRDQAGRRASGERYQPGE